MTTSNTPSPLNVDKELGDIELNRTLAHNYKPGDKLCLQLSQFPEAQAQIKALIESLVKQNRPKDKEVELTVPEEWTIGYNKGVEDTVQAILSSLRSES